MWEAEGLSGKAAQPVESFLPLGSRLSFRQVTSKVRELRKNTKSHTEGLELGRTLRKQPFGHTHKTRRKKQRPWPGRP